MILLILCSIIIGYFSFNRYFPVLGLHYVDKENLEHSTVNIVDLRDSNDSYKNPFKGAVNIPLAYLKRYNKELPKGELIVVASNHLEKNIGIRILRKRGFKVIGYTLTGLKYDFKNKEQINKERYC